MCTDYLPELILHVSTIFIMAIALFALKRGDKS